MAFDVGDLPGRAAELWQEAQRAYTDLTPSIRFPQLPSEWEDLDPRMVDEDRVLSLYDDFLDIPSPQDFAGMVDSVLRAMERVCTEGGERNGVVRVPNPTLAQVASSGGSLTNWTGNAALTYRTEYADKFDSMAAFQYGALEALAHALNAEAAVWQTVRDDLDKLSDDAIDQMRHVTDSRQSDFVAWLSVAGAVATVAVARGGSSWEVAGAGVAVAGTGLGLLSSGGDAEEEALDNGSPRRIIRSVESTLEKIKERIVEQEEMIRLRTDKNIELADTQWSSFCLPEPDLANATQGNVTSDGQMGHAI